MSVLKENLARVEERVRYACERAGRQREDVCLVAVTKTYPVEIIRQAYDLGLRHFGENKVQELREKELELPADVQWHMIGHLQSNKAKYIAPFVHLVHALDSIDTAKELSKRAEQHGRNIPVLLEVNVSGEASKHGVRREEIFSLIDGVLREAPALELQGLMTVASFEEEPEHTRPQFAALRQLKEEVERRHTELTSFRHLSMGMTNDFEVAIEEGATIIRIGSALFGARK